MPHPFRSLCVGLLVVAASASCRRQTADLGEMREQVLAHRQAAESARAERDPKAAGKAAKAALKLEERATKLVADKGEAATQDEKDALAAIVDAARGAMLEADLAREEAELADILTSLSAKAYGAGRKLMVAGVLKSLEASVAVMAREEPGKLAEAAEQPARVAAWLVGEPKQTDDSTGEMPETDWQNVATGLAALRGVESPELTTLLGVAFVLCNKPKLALCELDRIDPAAIEDPELLKINRLAHALACYFAGLRNLGVGEVRKLAAAGEGDETDGRREAAALHGTIAVFMLVEKEYELADREISRCIALWPDNPWIAMITGEVYAATGEEEKAVQSLATFAAGTKGEWMAKLVADRVREIRDHPDGNTTLFHNAEFRTRFVVEYVLASVKESAAMAKLAEMQSSARELGTRALQKLGFVGKEEGAGETARPDATGDPRTNGDASARPESTQAKSDE